MSSLSAGNRPITKTEGMLLSLVMVLFHVTCFTSCLPLTTSETMLVFLWAGLMLLKAFVHRTCLLDVTFKKKKGKCSSFLEWPTNMKLMWSLHLHSLGIKPGRTVDYQTRLWNYYVLWKRVNIQCFFFFHFVIWCVDKWNPWYSGIPVTVMWYLLSIFFRGLEGWCFSVTVRHTK